MRVPGRVDLTAMIRTLSFAVTLTLLSITLGACATGCPTALAQGVLVAESGTLVLHDLDDHTMALRWPSGYRVQEQDGQLALVDFFGAVKGREGDEIGMAGGVDANDIFQGCGDVFPVSIDGG